jgi:HEAT repeat protein
MRTVFLLFIALLLPLFAFPKERIGKVKIQVYQEVASGDDVSLPFYELASDFLNLIGIEVGEEKSPDYDAILEIRAKINTTKIRAPIYWGGEVPKDRVALTLQLLEADIYIPSTVKELLSEKESYLKRVEIKGAIRFESKEGKKVEEVFAGRSELTADPLANIYLDAFLSPGSFPEKLALLLGKVFGWRALLPALSSKDWKIAGSAEKAILQLASTNECLLLLKHPNPKIRGKIIKMLSKSNDQRVVGPIFEILNDRKKREEVGLTPDEIRNVIGELEAKFNPEEYIAKSGFTLFKEGYELLEKSGERGALALLSALEKGDIEPSEALFDTMAKIGKPCVEPLLKFLREGRLRSFQREIFIALGDIGDERAVDVIGDSLKNIVNWRLLDLYSGKVGAGFYALYKIGKPSERVLIPLLSHPDSQIKERAIVVLSTVSGKENWEKLYNIVLNQSDDLEVRRYALGALLKLDQERGKEVALKILRRDGDALRCAALSSLIRLNDCPEESVISILKCETEDYELMKLASFAAKQFKYKEAIPSLLAILSQQFQSFRDGKRVGLPIDLMVSCAETLAELIDAYKDEADSLFKESEVLLHSFIERLLKRNLELINSNLQPNIIEGIYWIGKSARLLDIKPELKDKAVETLIFCLSYAVGDIRARAAEALGYLKDKRAREPLLSLLNEDNSLDVYTSALHALNQLNEPIVAEYLAKLLKRVKHEDFPYHIQYEELKRFRQVGRNLLLELGKPVVPYLTAFVREEELYPDELFSEVIEILGLLRDEEAVDTLLSLLPFGYEYVPDYDEKILSALRLITNQDFGRDISLWRDWWRKRRMAR